MTKYKITLLGYDRVSEKPLGTRDLIVDSDANGSFRGAKDEKQIRTMYENLDFEQGSSVRESVLEVEALQI